MHANSGDRNDRVQSSNRLSRCSVRMRERELTSESNRIPPSAAAADTRGPMHQRKFLDPQAVPALSLRAAFYASRIYRILRSTASAGMRQPCGAKSVRFCSRLMP